MLRCCAAAPVRGTIDISGVQNKTSRKGCLASDDVGHAFRLVCFLGPGQVGPLAPGGQGAMAPGTGVNPVWSAAPQLVRGAELAPVNLFESQDETLAFVERDKQEQNHTQHQKTGGDDLTH